MRRRAEILVFGLLAGAIGAWAQAGRIRPPASLTCDRNQLTVFQGVPERWSRSSTEAQLELATDAGTRETFKLVFTGNEVEEWFLLEAEPLRAGDWPRVETGVGKLKDGVRAHVWVCTGNANPVIDWRLPQP